MCIWNIQQSKCRMHVIAYWNICTYIPVAHTRTHTYTWTYIHTYTHTYKVLRFLKWVNVSFESDVIWLLFKYLHTHSRRWMKWVRVWRKARYIYIYISYIYDRSIRAILIHTQPHVYIIFLILYLIYIYICDIYVVYYIWYIYIYT